MVDFGGGRCRGFWGGYFLDISIGLGALFTEGLVEGAAQLQEEEYKSQV